MKTYKAQIEYINYLKDNRIISETYTTETFEEMMKIHEMFTTLHEVIMFRYTVINRLLKKIVEEVKEMNNKVYIVVEDWSFDCDCGTTITIFNDFQNALDFKDECIKTIKENYINDDYIIDETEQSFSTYEECNYRYAHSDVYVEEKEVK